MITQLNEFEIKRVILAHLRRTKAINSKSIIASEFVIPREQCRADLAILSGEFIGIEIKSKFDSLGRLEKQIDSYSRFFDRLIVACDVKHLSGVLALASDFTEVWSVDENTQINVVKVGASGRPALAAKDRIQMLKLPELRELAGVPTRATVSRSTLLALCSELPPARLAQATRSSFERAFGGVSQAFWRSVSGAPVSSVHVAGLSRFGAHRERSRAIRHARSAFDVEWQLAAAALFGSWHQTMSRT